MLWTKVASALEGLSTYLTYAYPGQTHYPYPACKYAKYNRLNQVIALRGKHNQLLVHNYPKRDGWGRRNSVYVLLTNYTGQKVIIANINKQPNYAFYQNPER